MDIAELPPLHGNAAQMQELLRHLLRNALQAVMEGGEVRLEVHPRGEVVVITVSDTGCGMDPELLRRIWDPFFTTRAVGQGAGLGLTLAHSIVKRHGGDIEVDSVPGKGSRFTVRLPLRAR